MFDYDKWQEIFFTIKRNKLRTFLTMFGVFWGIFMLLALLGAGQGLENGIIHDFSGWATNGGFIWTQRTSMPYRGFKPGRFVKFTTEDAVTIRKSIPEVDLLAPRNQLGGFRSGNNVIRYNKAGAFNVYGDYPEYHDIQKVNLYLGRTINPLDIKDKRKIAVIGQSVRDVLFDPKENPIGKYITIKGVFFQVVGVFRSLRSGDRAFRDTQSVFVPFTTFQLAFNYGNRVGWFAFTAKKDVKVTELETKIINLLKKRHQVHPDDPTAFGNANLQEEFEKMTGLFTGIKIFVWLVGIGTLLAGVIGVSNIMLIIVKERTKELAIRKSVGASPSSIIYLILQEAVFITGIAGYFGLFTGIVLLEIINFALRKLSIESNMFRNPEVSFSIAIASLIVLIVGGVFAGLIPAKRAAAINPIEALRTE